MMKDHMASPAPIPSELDAKSQENSYIARVQTLLGEEKTSAALDLLDEGLRLFPVSSPLLVLQGKAFESMRQWEKAEGCYWRSLKEPFSPVPESFLSLAQVRHVSGEPEKALWFLEEGLSLFPENNDLLREAGIQNGLLGQWWLAFGRIRKAFVDQPSKTQNMLAYGALLERLSFADLLPELIPLYEKLVEQDPAITEHQILYARALERNNQIRKAIKHVRTLLKTNPKNPVLLKEIGRLLLNLNEHTRSIDSLRLSMESAGESAETHYFIAMAYKASGKPLAGIEAIKRALSMEPDNPEYETLLGLLYIDLGEPDKAFTAFQSLEEAFPFRSLGDLYLRKKSSNKAITAYMTAFEKDPDPRTGLLLLKLLSSRKDWFLFFETLAWMEILFPDKIEKKFLTDKLLSRWKEDQDFPLTPAESLAIRALSLYFAGNREAAFPLLEQAVLADPLSEVLYWMLGLLEEERGNKEAALTWYGRILHSTREPVTLFHTMARVRTRGGDSFAVLEQMLESFLAHYSSRPGFYRVLHEWALRTENRHKAPEILMKAMTVHPNDVSLYELFCHYHPDLSGRDGLPPFSGQKSVSPAV
ncbi:MULTISPECIES: tetratricopeptide repeat protein [Leptospirillum]|jgi:tetratricopeptide (TPR) repeat protein|uniref:Tetratricopeptide repeat protein n=2 Tax=Leptospirillum ferriphilum TaxID=178606 RepID=A0A059XSP7_9BACT|nr:MULTISPECIES: tetratricopeptide repeat protein [Leptospirillum]EAY57183.1 MAG: protein of unknown function [Leptospirillum rubarum]EIJ77183.1 MAG: hypothetical protein C75L2_00680032 [Leptospirillum sp. Group II 'C75']AIA31639.1 hypothetical protein Y981_04955 [Leptospirillum ferriphilum YSK]AKS23736.1 hypothetical protein ABH19_08260 [Leptospirillum sp. Group II 'CF-1']OOH75104.1 hypothetical protein BOX24_00790 [Leptospirillum ferriphilum]